MKRLLIVVLFLMACGLIVANPTWPIPPSPPATGAGTGDMSKATYDTNSNNVVDTAATASALAADPADCAAGSVATAIAASGALTCGKTIGTDIQTELSILKGTYTNTYLCKYTSSGTLLDCNVDPAGFQTADADLTTYAGITPSANIQSLLGSADYATARTNLGLAIGTNVQAYDATLLALAAQTESQGALQYYTADATPAVLAKGTQYQLLQQGATAPEWTSSLSISALNLTSATSSIPMVVGTGTASGITEAGRLYFESDTEILTIGDGATSIGLDMAPNVVYTFPTATATLASKGTLTNTKWCSSDGTVINCTEDAPAGSGDITAVGSCTTGSCATIGNADTTGGYIDFLEDSDNGTNYVRLKAPDSTADATVTLPGTTGTLAILGANTFTASQTITGDVLPEAANTRALGGTSAEYNKAYLGDGAIIYGQNDQSNTITSSATGWSFAKPITIADVANDNYIKITDNAGGRAATASVFELYPSSGVWQMNTNGTAAPIQKQVAHKLAVFTWDGGASALTAAAGTKRCAFVPAAATLTGLYASTQAESTSDITIAMDKDAFAAGAHATTDWDIISSDQVVTIPAAGTVLNVNTTSFTASTITAGDQICATITATDTTTWLQLTLYGTY